MHVSTLVVKEFDPVYSDLFNFNVFDQRSILERCETRLRMSITVRFERRRRDEAELRLLAEQRIFSLI